MSIASWSNASQNSSYYNNNNNSYFNNSYFKRVKPLNLTEVKSQLSSSSSSSLPNEPTNQGQSVFNTSWYRNYSNPMTTAPPSYANSTTITSQNSSNPVISAVGTHRKWVGVGNICECKDCAFYIGAGTRRDQIFIPWEILRSRPFLRRFYEEAKNTPEAQAGGSVVMVIDAPADQIFKAVMIINDPKSNMQTCINAICSVWSIHKSRQKTYGTNPLLEQQQSRTSTNTAPGGPNIPVALPA